MSGTGNQKLRAKLIEMCDRNPKEALVTMFAIFVG